VFYRVLDDSVQDKRPQEHSTLRRWKRCAFNSSNESYPAEWETAWNERCRRKSSFRLKCGTGRYTRRARRKFMWIAKRYGLYGTRMKDARWRVGEIEGVYSYRTPLAAWEYLNGVLAGNYVAEFHGVELRGVSIAEPDAAQVRVTRPVRVIPASQFAQEHGYHVEPDPEQSIIDEAVYEDEP
jgi:hypothetical protein